MIRIRRDDFEDPHELAKFAATAGMSLEEFRAQFESLFADEPPGLDFGAPLPVEHPEQIPRSTG